MKSKRTIKLISAILVLIFIASVFTGCMGDPVDKTWFDEDNNTTVSADSLFPYNQVTNFNAVVSVGFDKIFGISRALVRYRGEIPYYYSHNSEGKAYAGLEQEPYTASYNGQEIKMDSNHFSITWNEYWGPIVLNEVVTPQELESVNEDAIVSLRLYAWRTSTSKNWFFNLLYSIVKGLSWLGSKLCNLIVIIKNINIVAIMDALGLESLTQTINDIFLAKRDDAGHIISISPFAVFAIIAFIISLVGFVLSYIRGTKKEKSLWSDIVLLGIAGLLVIGIALSNNALSIGSWIADLSARLTQTVTELGGGSTYMWTTKTDNTGGNSPNISMELQNTETSIVNKILIDMQICAQFGVSRIEELDLSTLENSDTIPLATKYLTKYFAGRSDITPVDKNHPMTGEQDANKRDKLVNRLGNNLGYYYWWATASQTNYGYAYSNISKMFITNNRQADKLDEMITYLQVLYNKARADNDVTQQNKIINILDHFAKPDPGANIVSMLVLFIIYILLVICLFKYAIKIVLAKLSLLAGILALPIAGILICTTNKNLVKTGKGLLGMFVMSFLRITIFSIFFDLVIYIVGALVSTDIVRLLICGVLLGLMWKLNPAIDKAIENALANVERTVAPEAREMKAQAKAYARRKISESQNRLREKNGKIVGYDAEGNAIRTTSRGGIYDTILRNADNMLTDDPTSRKSAFKISREAKKDKQADLNTAKKEVIDAADALRRKEYDDAASHTNDILQDINIESAMAFDEAYDPETGEYDVTKLTGYGELDSLDEINESQRLLEDNINDDTYKALRKKKLNKEALTEDEQAQYDEYKERADELQRDIYEKKVKLSAKVRSRIDAETHRKHADELREALERQQKASDNILTENGESIIERKRGKTTYSKNLTREDFANADLVQRQLEELDRIEQGENIGIEHDLSAEEVREAHDKYDAYVREENLLGYGKIKKQKKSNDAMFDTNVNRTIENRNQLRNDANDAADEARDRHTRERQQRRERHTEERYERRHGQDDIEDEETTYTRPERPRKRTRNSAPATPLPETESEVSPADYAEPEIDSGSRDSSDSASEHNTAGRDSAHGHSIGSRSSSSEITEDVDPIDDPFYTPPTPERKPPIKFSKPSGDSTPTSDKPVSSGTESRPVNTKPVDQPRTVEPKQAESKLASTRAEKRAKKPADKHTNKPKKADKHKSESAKAEPIVESTTTADDYKISIDTAYQPITQESLERNSPGMQTELPLSRREQRRQAKQEKKRIKEQQREPYIPSTHKIDVGESTDQYKLNNEPIDLDNSSDTPSSDT